MPLALRQTSATAWLPEHRVNVTLGPREERILITGLHTVADIYCSCCGSVLGWKYVRGRGAAAQTRGADCLRSALAHILVLAVARAWCRRWLNKRGFKGETELFQHLPCPLFFPRSSR